MHQNTLSGVRLWNSAGADVFVGATGKDGLMPGEGDGALPVPARHHTGISIPLHERETADKRQTGVQNESDTDECGDRLLKVCRPQF